MIRWFVLEVAPGEFRCHTRVVIKCGRRSQRQRITVLEQPLEHGVIEQRIVTATLADEKPAIAGTELERL
jgi:hypothetical protein